MPMWVQGTLDEPVVLGGLYALLIQFEQKGVPAAAQVQIVERTPLPGYVVHARW